MELIGKKSPATNALSACVPAMHELLRAKRITPFRRKDRVLALHSPTYVIDFDSTIIRLEALEELAELALAGRPDHDDVMRRLHAINKRGMSGELTFDQSLRQRLRLFGTTHEHIDRLITLLEQNLSASVERNRGWFKRNAGQIYIISGAFEEYVKPVVTGLGIPADHVFANAFVFGADGRVAGCDDSRLASQAGGKIRQLKQLNLPRPIIVIGDGYTDYEMRSGGEADSFWAFCENVKRPNVIEAADKVVSSFDEVVSADVAAAII